MGTKHTPGPWTSAGSTVFDAAGLPIAAVPHGPTKRRVRDAKLIAAAPELLAALEALLEAYSDPTKFCLEIHELREQKARDAIARATGSEGS